MVDGLFTSSDPETTTELFFMSCSIKNTFYIYIEELNDDQFKKLTSNLTVYSHLQKLKLQGLEDQKAGLFGGFGKKAADKDKKIRQLSEVVGWAFPELTDLDLSRNSISDVGAKALATGIATCVSLTTIVLSSNQIGNDGAIEIGKAITHCPQLKELLLFDNQIGDAGLSALGMMLASCENLQVVYITNNKFSTKAYDELKNVLSGIHFK